MLVSGLVGVASIVYCTSALIGTVRQVFLHSASRVTVSISGGKVTLNSAYNTLFEHHGVGYATLGGHETALTALLTVSKPLRRALSGLAEAYVQAVGVASS